VNTQQFYDWLGKPRSVTSLLAPISTQESGIECLSSYLIRNQQALGINASQLLAYSAMVLENSEQSLVKSHLFSTNAMPLNVNGNGERTETLCAALSHLKPEVDFKGMTLKGFEHKTNGLLLQPKLKSHVHWCSHCFDDWRKTGVDIHYPLAWLLQGNHSCQKHGKPFSNICPHCGMQHKSLNRYLIKGECSRCKGALTKPSHLRVVGQTELF
jgi:hypothetical protein